MENDQEIRLTAVTPANIDKTGFFCFRNRRSEEGYSRKKEWLLERFDEGLKIQLITEGGLGFIEYIPGEYAWRGVNADGYMFIHCLWVTGKRRNVGCGTALLETCFRDARETGKKGVAMITSEGYFMMSKRFMLKHDFVSVENYPPSFKLMVKKFEDAPDPSFTGNWDEKLAAFGEGLTVITSDHCPHHADAVNVCIETSKELGVKYRIVELKSSRDVREKSPSPFGTFGLVYNGKFVDHYTFNKKTFLKQMAKVMK
ncbi:MAG: YoaP domain-containing protein [Candidatus Electryonea clarkiae]|nr:YoaP domain-containing protein [Candidatus Electryonea clarkiae]MDP8287371.1 YoaP domain-containing protein [Candidatus Electryonea clarkiae]